MKIWGKLLLFYIFAMLVIGYAFQATYKYLRVDILNQRTVTQQTAYSSVLQSSRILADTFFNEVLNREEILSLVQQIVHTDGDEQRTLRGLLHRSLSATYQRSKKDVAEVLHFHFPDNRTMLRFHRPQKVDDDLTLIRPSIVMVNSSLHEVHGYEPGRHAHAYRHIYPLTYHGEHIGSVEVSNPYYVLYRKAQQLETATQTQFVFFQKKAELYEKLFRGDDSYHVASEIHQDFTRLKNIPELLLDQRQRDNVTAEVKPLLGKLKNEVQVQVKMSQGVVFSQSIHLNNQFFSVVFQPVTNISGENSGYLVGITPEPQIQKLVDQFWIYYFMTGAILLGILVYRGVLQSDLQDKKKTEVALQAFFDNKLIGMFSQDIDGFYQRVNHQWEEMTGYRQDELLTMNYRDLIPPDDLNQQSLVDVLGSDDSHQTFKKIKRYLRKDGSVFWGDLSVTGLYGERNQLIGMVGIINDITEGKKAEEALHEAITIINRSPAVAFLWKNEEGWPVEFVSENVKDLSGYSAPIFLEGEFSYLEMIHSEDVERVKEEVVKGSQQEDQQSFTHTPYRIIAENGKTKWINDTTYIRRDTQGQITHYEGVVYDITELKQVEAELSEHKMHLEDLVKEQTIDLEEKVSALEEKAKQLEKSEQSLTYLMEDVNASREELQSVNGKYAAINTELKEFAYIVSHDLKAPLRAISQLTHWISEDYSDAFDDDGKMQMGLILQRVKRMDGLIEGILRYSRIGQIRGKVERIDLNRLVTEIIENMAPPETVQVTIENKLPVLYLDNLRLGQVFQNFIDNAIKYMDKDKGIIKIDCVQEETFWKFSVSDNGPGIDKKYHDKVFQIFQTLAPRDEHESTGIGMALVKKIIDIYGGSIWIESEAGCGTTFFFTLPKKETIDEKL